MNPCSTLEQRWSACRARVYGDDAYGKGHGYCDIWGQWSPTRRERRPCTSPRRHQCRSGGVQLHPWIRCIHYEGEQAGCAGLF